MSKFIVRSDRTYVMASELVSIPEGVSFMHAQNTGELLVFGHKHIPLVLKKDSKLGRDCIPSGSTLLLKEAGNEYFEAQWLVEIPT